jgi:hypothetical protein
MMWYPLQTYFWGTMPRTPDAGALAAS